MTKDEAALYELLGKFKDALIAILEEAESEDRDWREVIDHATYALDQLED